VVLIDHSISAPFDQSIKYIFHGFKENEEPFTDRIRSLLVNNILNSLNVSAKTDIKNLGNLNMRDFIEDGNNYAPQFDFTTFKKQYMIADQGLKAIFKCLTIPKYRKLL
jgi:hypothetical protein